VTSIIVTGAGAGRSSAVTAIGRTIEGHRLAKTLARVVAQRVGGRWMVFMCDAADVDIQDPELHNRLLAVLDGIG
jgi:hypothetical protein